MAASSLVYLGIRGHVVALDRATGTEVWRRPLRGADFVNLALVDGQLLAATKGEVYCLDAGSGEVRWHNRLPGLGWGLVSFAPGAGIASQETLRRQRAAAAAAAGS